MRRVWRWRRVLGRGGVAGTLYTVAVTASTVDGQFLARRARLFVDARGSMPAIPSRRLLPPDRRRRQCPDETLMHKNGRRPGPQPPAAPSLSAEEILVFRMLLAVVRGVCRTLTSALLAALLGALAGAVAWFGGLFHRLWPWSQ